jgi:hypothetical protein
MPQEVASGDGFFAVVAHVFSGIAVALQFTYV